MQAGLVAECRRPLASHIKRRLHLATIGRKEDQPAAPGQGGLEGTRAAVRWANTVTGGNGDGMDLALGILARGLGALGRPGFFRQAGQQLPGIGRHGSRRTRDEEGRREAGTGKPADGGDRVQGSEGGRQHGVLAEQHGQRRRSGRPINGQGST